MEEQLWHEKTAEEVLSILHSREAGLTATEATTRLAEYGKNELPKAKTRGWLRIFAGQFQSPLIYVLFFADAAGFFLGEYTDAFIILFILLFNAILGAIQEGKAEQTLAALSQFVETRAEILRDNKELNILDAELVPGDIILLQEGEKVPADARLIAVANLLTNEGALTGESEPVRKITTPLHGEHLATAEQKNMIFKGTTVAAGTGKAVVVATGLTTVIGKISSAIAAVSTEIPLTKNLNRLAKIVVGIVLAIIVFIFTTGIIEGENIKDMFIAAVAISVAAVPEGLPLVLTVTLATGVWRMAKRRVLVKKLPAVEALGQAQEIAVDKTGTITKNELVIEKVITGSDEFDIGGVGYEPRPLITHPSSDLSRAATIAAFCSNARISRSDATDTYRLVGDPTEGALTAFATKAGVSKNELLKTYSIVTDWPFDYGKKFHLALVEKAGVRLLAMTGAPEIVINLCTMILKKEAIAPFDQHMKATFEAKFSSLSENGLRVIAYAFLEHPGTETDPDRLPPLIFGGLFAMRDALRPGIREQILQAKEAGIRVFMITGDHAITAKSIAKQAAIYEEGDLVLTGADLDAMSADDLAAKLPKTTVFARVTPEHKMKIIQDYRRRGEIIAMTGDGVNDAPPLVAADLGIAMGKIGTEVAKEASDLVLLDDNFGDILSAVEEGRNLRQGIRRTITYLFSSNLGEILLILLALLSDFPLPLLAAQLIWMNVVTDTFFDISLALEPKNPSLMRKGIKISKQLFDRFIATRLILIAPTIAAGSFFLFHREIADPTRARTIALTALIIFQWFNALNCRSEEKSIFQMNPFSNKYLLATLGWVIALHLFAIYNPFMNNILRISPLHLKDWLNIALVALAVVGIEEIRKIFYRKKLAALAAHATS